VFDNRVLRNIFGPKRDKVTGGWGRLFLTENMTNEMYRACGTCRKQEKCMQVFGGET
jgi:hypothetical protein